MSFVSEEFVAWPRSLRLRGYEHVLYIIINIDAYIFRVSVIQIRGAGFGGCVTCLRACAIRVCAARPCFNRAIHKKLCWGVYKK